MLLLGGSRGLLAHNIIILLIIIIYYGDRFILISIILTKHDHHHSLIAISNSYGSTVRNRSSKLHLMHFTVLIVVRTYCPITILIPRPVKRQFKIIII